ncbi:MAG: hypothetical protein ACRD4G_00500 [Bryobacteraceae bacterium]
MNCKIPVFAISLLCACIPSLQAQTSEDQKGQQVVDQAIAALGGEHFLQMKTLIQAGHVYSFYHDRLSGNDRAHMYTEYAAEKPGKGLGVRTREAFGKKQDYSFLYLPTEGWQITYRGARAIPEDRWKSYVRNTENNIFYILRVRHNEPGIVYRYAGAGVLITSEVQIVDIVDSQNRTVRVYFDRNTHLPIRETYKWFDSKLNYQNDEEVDFSKYRDAGGGVMWPFTVERSRNGYKSYQFFADSAEAGQPIPTLKFELPPGIKMLKKIE